MDFYDILYAKYLSKLNGGGSSVKVEPLSVTENGTYTESGKAYSPVNVNVPQPSGSINITSNGTVDVTDYANANVMVLPSNPTISITVDNTSGSDFTYYEIYATTGGIIRQPVTLQNNETSFSIHQLLTYKSYSQPYTYSLCLSDMNINGTRGTDYQVSNMVNCTYDNGYIVVTDPTLAFTSCEITVLNQH